MNANEPIVNKVTQSALISLNLSDFLDKREKVVYDLKENLFQGLILKEKDFREFLKNHDWQQYKDKNVALTCSTDAIVPTWAYMLLVAYLEPHANYITFGTSKDLEKELFRKKLAAINLESYKDAKVVIKGCSELPFPEYALVEITKLLKPIVSSLMFGEPCSTVPIYKKLKNS